MIKELWYRHLLKTGTWRVIAFLALGAISYYLTGSIVMATSIALADWLVKTALYFTHELIWSKLNIGRVLEEKGGCVVWLTGLSGSGKTTVADAVADKLRKRLINASRLDGDVARKTFSSDLGFSKEDRAENCRRAAHVASYLKTSSIVLASFISPDNAMRSYAGGLIGKDYIEVFVDCPIGQCVKRDPKGMYAKLKNGAFHGVPFTGMHREARYERPQTADLVLHTDEESISESAEKVIELLTKRGYL